MFRVLLPLEFKVRGKGQKRGGKISKKQIQHHRVSQADNWSLLHSDSNLEEGKGTAHEEMDG